MAFAVFVGLSLATCATLLLTGTVDARTLQESVQASGLKGVLLYMALSIVLQLLWLPRSWTILGAAALFGPVRGLAVSLVSDTLSALLCYGLARTAGQSWVASLVERRPRAKRVLRVLARRRGALTLALLRSTPVAHYTLVSYLAGLAAVPLGSYVVGNTIGLLPGAAVYSLAGGSLMDPSSPLFVTMIAVVAAAFVLTLVFGRRVTRWLMAGSDDGEASSPAARAALAGSGAASTEGLPGDDGDAGGEVE